MQVSFLFFFFFFLHTLSPLFPGLGLPTDDLRLKAKDEIKKLYDFFIKVCVFWSMLIPLTRLGMQYDCTLVEINPFVSTQDGRVLCLDAKVTWCTHVFSLSHDLYDKCQFDDNAAFRQKEVFALRDFSQEVKGVGQGGGERACVWSLCLRGRRSILF